LQRLSTALALAVKVYPPIIYSNLGKNYRNNSSVSL